MLLRECKININYLFGIKCALIFFSCLLAPLSEAMPEENKHIINVSELNKQYETISEKFLGRSAVIYVTALDILKINPDKRDEISPIELDTFKNKLESLAKHEHRWLNNKALCKSGLAVFSLGLGIAETVVTGGFAGPAALAVNGVVTTAGFTSAKLAHMHSDKIKDIANLALRIIDEIKYNPNYEGSNQLVGDWILELDGKILEFKTFMERLYPLSWNNLANAVFRIHRQCICDDISKLFDEAPLYRGDVRDLHREKDYLEKYYAYDTLLRSCDSSIMQVLDSILASLSALSIAEVAISAVI